MSHKKPDQDKISLLPPIQVRIVPEIKEWLTTQAKTNHRSFAGELNYRLEQMKKNECV